MNPETLTFELFHGGEWHTAAELTILNPNTGIDGPTRRAYRDDYIVAHVASFREWGLL